MNELIDFLESGEKEKLGLSWEQVGQRFNRSSESARGIWKRHRLRLLESRSDEAEDETLLSNFSMLNDEDSGVKWVPSKKWQVQKKGGETDVLYSWRTDLGSPYFEDFLAGIKEIKLDCPDPIINVEDSEYCAVFGTSDLHFGGSGTTLRDQREQLKRAVEETMLRAEPYELKEVYIIVGSDALDMDGFNNTTTRGTPRQLTAHWHEVFKEASLAYIELILSLSKRCVVRVVVIPGNHDETLSLVLGDVLEARFTDNPNVRIHNEADSSRKVLRYGSNLLTFWHGHAGKAKELPLYVASCNSKEWSETTHRFFFSGHIHKLSATIDDYYKNYMVVFPTLRKPDSWHRENAYLSNMALQTWILRKSGGWANIINIE